MPDKGLAFDNWKRVLAERAETTGWALCVGAGISDPIFPDWSKLLEKMASEDREIVDTKKLIRMLRKSFSLDALIEAARDRLQLDSSTFADRLSAFMYADFRRKIGNARWPKILEALTSGSPNQMKREDWNDFLEQVHSLSPTLTARQLAEVVYSARVADREPAAIITFNAEPLLFALINAVSAREAPPEDKLKYHRLLDRVTRGISYRKAGRIPYIFCHGLLPVEGGREVFNRSASQDKLVFSEGEYLQLANSAFSWQSSLFLGTAVLRSMVFVGISFTAIP